MIDELAGKQNANIILKHGIKSPQSPSADMDVRRKSCVVDIKSINYFIELVIMCTENTMETQIIRGSKRRKKTNRQRKIR